MPLMEAFGKFHDLETGAARYIRGLHDPSFESGVFYGSEFPGVTGKLVDQSTIFADLGNKTIQDNANEAIHRFIPETSPSADLLEISVAPIQTD